MPPSPPLEPPPPAVEPQQLPQLPDAADVTLGLSDAGLAIAATEFAVPPEPDIPSPGPPADPPHGPSTVSLGPPADPLSPSTLANSAAVSPAADSDASCFNSPAFLPSCMAGRAGPYAAHDGLDPPPDAPDTAPSTELVSDYLASSSPLRSGAVARSSRPGPDVAAASGSPLRFGAAAAHTRAEAARAEVHSALLAFGESRLGHHAARPHASQPPHHAGDDLDSSPQAPDTAEPSAHRQPPGMG